MYVCTFELQDANNHLVVLMLVKHFQINITLVCSVGFMDVLQLWGYLLDNLQWNLVSARICYDKR